MAEGYGSPLGRPLRKRAFQVFLSHAHVDREMIDRLNLWLSGAGLKTWYDAERMRAGQPFPDALAEGIAASKGMIVALSRRALDSGWVASETNLGLFHQNAFRGFSVIPVRLEPCSLPPGLQAHSAADAFDGKLDGREAARLLRGIHGVPGLAVPTPVKDHVVDHLSALAGDPSRAPAATRMPVVYLTCGWRDTPRESVLRRTASRVFVEEGFHLIGDAEDHEGTEPRRIADILGGCSGQLVLVPKRAHDLEHPEYKSLRSEISIGQDLDLPQFVIAEAGVDVGERLRASTHFVEVPDSEGASTDLEPALRRCAEDLRERWSMPENPHYVFVATDYEDLVVKDHVVRHIEQITGLPCLKGSDFGRQVPSRKIEIALRDATLVISNIVSRTLPSGLPEVNWNTCIEAGIALGAGRQVHMIGRKGAHDTWSRENLPFMIRHNTVETYSDDQELMALVHRYARPFRRRIVAASQ